MGYQIDAAYELERGAVEYDWTSNNGVLFKPLVNGTQIQTLTLPNTMPSLGGPISGSSSYQVLGDQVFRFDFCYLTTTGAPGAVPTLASTPSGQIKAMVDLLRWRFDCLIWLRYRYGLLVNHPRIRRWWCMVSFSISTRCFHGMKDRI